MKKILVVGGAGYVGAVLTAELLERGYAVKILDRLYYGDYGLRDVRERVELLVGDMRMVEPSVFDDVDAVVNIGGLSNDPTAEYNPRANYEMNTVAARRLAEMCKEQGVRRYVFGSTCSIYDRGIGEDARDVVLDEEAEVNPKAAYSSAKYSAEKALLEMADECFCPVILRKGTIYGFSPRMRYDLVVNTFVRDALYKHCITVFYGGEMWRPLIDVRDVARAYVACLDSDENRVRGQVFNLAHGNFRISELALRVREALRQIGVDVDVKTDYAYRGVRSYRVNTEKIHGVLKFVPCVSVEESVRDMVERIEKYGYTDFENPRYYNLRWMEVLEEARKIITATGTLFEAVSVPESAGSSVIAISATRRAK